MKTLRLLDQEWKVEVLNYYTNPLCMGIVLSNEDGDFIPTVNLGDEIGNDSIMQMGCAFLDTNNYRGVEHALEETGLVEPYTRFGTPVRKQSGWCSYPLYSFNIKMLEELDPEGTAVYKKRYKNAYQQWLDKVLSEES